MTTAYTSADGIVGWARVTTSAVGLEDSAQPTKTPQPSASTGPGIRAPRSCNQPESDGALKPRGRPCRPAGVITGCATFAQQWKSGIAAWLGWLFDGLDMHLVRARRRAVCRRAFGVPQRERSVGRLLQLLDSGCLPDRLGVGGGLFGRVADRLGRSRALMLTILTYALLPGCRSSRRRGGSCFFRFLAALGIGGEWAVGASLLSETWPRSWRPWMAAVLQTGVNLGVMLAGLATFCLAGYPSALRVPGRRPSGLPGALDSLGRARAGGMAKGQATGYPSRSRLRRAISRSRPPDHRVDASRLSLSLTAHWAFLFWYAQHLRNLPDAGRLDRCRQSQLVSKVVGW